METAAQTTAGATKSSDGRGSDQVIEKWLGERRRMTREEIKRLVDIARTNDGELVNVAAFGAGVDGDDWCGTMWFKKPRPKLGGVIDSLLDAGWHVQIFPRGIPVVSAFEVIVRTQSRR